MKSGKVVSEKETGEFEIIFYKKTPYTNGYKSADKHILRLYGWARDVVKDSDKYIEETKMSTASEAVAWAVPHYIDFHKEEKFGLAGRLSLPEKRGGGMREPYTRIKLRGKKGAKAEIDAFITGFFTHGDSFEFSLPKVERTLNLRLPAEYANSEKFEKKEKELTKFWPLGMGYKKIPIKKA